jgi:hypothetical protein
MATIRLKNGVRVSDPRLGRIKQFDERSRGFAVRDHPDYLATPTTKTWPDRLRLDQGQTSACTGFSRTGDLGASPKPLTLPGGKPFDNDFAQALYLLAQKNDEWPGEKYEGSSVLGALKASVLLGYTGEYRWAFGIDDVIGALSSLGPVVFGTNWLSGMFDPDAQGLLDVSGSVEGGHAYLVRGVVLPRNGRARPGGFPSIKTDVPLLRITNSWSETWGRNGEALIRADQAESLLKDGGEAAITTVAFR